MQGARENSQVMSRFILGTVQLGMPYGISNRVGQPQESEGIELLRVAFQNGIRAVDSSDLYGTSDSVIKKALGQECQFDIHTKFILDERLDIRSALANSLNRLGVAKIKSYSFHRYSDFVMAQKAWGQGAPILSDLKSSGAVERIGASVYSVEEAVEALNCPWIDQIQMPLNLLDHSGRRKSVFQMVENSGKTLHVRSVYLQGLFHLPLNEQPESLKPLAPAIQRLQNLAIKKRLLLPQLALLYPLSLPLVHGLVIGLESIEQLNLNMSWFKDLEPLDRDSIQEIESIMVDRPDLLSPVNWKK